MGGTASTCSHLRCGWLALCIATHIARVQPTFSLISTLGSSARRRRGDKTQHPDGRLLPLALPQQSDSEARPKCCGSRLTDGRTEVARWRFQRSTEHASVQGPVLQVLIPLRARGDPPIASRRRQVGSGRRPSRSTFASVVLSRASKARWPEQQFSKPFTGRWT